MRPRVEPTDDDLLVSGEPAAFGVFYERRVREVLGYMMRRTGDAEATRDEEQSANRGPAPAPPAHITNRNWKPVTPDPDAFQLTLSATAWTAVPEPEHDRKHGHLRWSGERIIVNADPPCTVTGVYRVDLAENRLTLTAEDDRCEQRRDLLERRWFALP